MRSMARSFALLFALAAVSLLAAAGCDDGSTQDPTDTVETDTTAGDTSGGDTVSPGDTGDDTAAPDTVDPDTTAPDTTPPDTSGGDTSDAETTADVEPDTVGGGWTVPTCDTVQGTGGVLITEDQGLTWTAAQPPLTGIVYTTGLTTLETPGRMLVVVGGRLLRSDDAGCTWSDVGDLTSDGLVRLSAAGGDRAWAWGDNRQFLKRIDTTDAETVVTDVKIELPDIIGLGVDPSDPDHVVIGDHYGQLSVTTDGGATWTAQGVPANASEIAIGYRVAFAPDDLDHVVYGGATLGARTSTDGGRTWRDASGLGEAEGHPANVFAVVVSPADPQVVWAVALDVSIDLPNADRRLMRSVDGGETFAEVGREGPDVTFSNSPGLFVHPTDTDVAYLAWGSCFQAYGTDLFRFDAASGAMTKTHNPWHRLDALAFSPADPEVMYLGVSSEGAGGAGTGCSG